MIMLAANVKVALVQLMSNLLALDQASHTTGYAIFKDNKIIKVSHFTCSSSDLGERLFQLRQNIQNLIEEYDIDEVIFEDIQLQDVNGSKEVGIKTFKMLAEVFGVVYELVTELKIKNITVLPIKWKSHFKIAGKGRAQEKKMSQAFALNNYSLKCTEDEADAFCIGLYHIDKSNSFDWS